MGYTHYWDKGEGKITAKQWDELCDTATRIIALSGVPVRYEYNTKQTPQIDSGSIRFNGVDDDGHETFMLGRFDSHGFCKTNRKPYDTLVVAILIAAHEIAPDWLTWGSDGDKDDHEAGRLLRARS